VSQPYTPHAYQKKAIKFLVAHACAGLFLDPGLGKTSIVLAAFKLLKAKGYLRKMLVIAPLRPAYSTWPGEVQKWKDFSDLKVVVLHGPDKDKLLKSDADVYVINPEGLQWLFRSCPPAKSWLWDMLVVDESTRFKHTNTQRFKTIRPFLDYFKRRYILTGSPAPNGLMDLFGQIYLLDLGNALGRFVTHYRMSYFDATGYGGYTWVLRAGAEEQIYKKIQPLVLRMSAADYLDLEPYIPNVVPVELPSDARKVYDQMESTMLAEVENGIVTAANAAAATGKCRQIANGGLYLAPPGGTETKRGTAAIHEAKLDAVEEIIEELQGKPALIAYEFDHDRIRLQERLGDVPYIGGGVSTTKFKQIETRWNAGLIPVLLAQPQSVAHGLNLQGTGAAVIWHSLTWDLENYEQLIRRVWRQGQRERVVVHHIVAKDTIDEVIMRTVNRKDKTQKALLEALKERAKERKAA
jgi:SNF2 family DNA or RNA helicase